MNSVLTKPKCLLHFCKDAKVQKHNVQLRWVFPNDAIQLFDIIVAVNDISDEAPYSMYLLRQIASDEWQGAATGRSGTLPQDKELPTQMRSWKKGNVPGIKNRFLSLLTNLDEI